MKAIAIAEKLAPSKRDAKLFDRDGVTTVIIDPSHPTGAVVTAHQADALTEPSYLREHLLLARSVR